MILTISGDSGIIPAPPKTHPNPRLPETSMNHSLRLSTLVFVLATAATVNASSVSYDFTGTFDQPINGSTEFSGTFRYDTDVTLATGVPATGGLYKDAQAGTLISMNFTSGTITSSSLGPMVESWLHVSHLAQYDMINIEVAFKQPGGQTLWQTFDMAHDNTKGPGPFASGMPPATLSLSDFDGASFHYTSPDHPDRYAGVGRITSLTATVPEPSTMAVLLIGFGGLAVGRRNGWRMTAPARS